MTRPKRHARLSEDKENEVAQHFAGALLALNAVNAELLDTMYDGAHAVFITDRAARKFYGIDQGFADAENIEAIVIERTKALWIANAIDPAVGLQVASVDPATPTIIPMLMLLRTEGAEGVYVKPGKLLAGTDAAVAPTLPAPPEHTPDPEASPSDKQP